MDQDSTSSGWRLSNDGHIHRRRRISYPNGDEYNGELVNGQRDGFGVLKTSTFKYTGCYYDLLVST